MKPIKKILKPLSAIALIFSLMACQVTLEQGQQLEDAGKIKEASQLYFEIVKGDVANYPADMKNTAYDKILSLDEPGNIIAILPQALAATDPLSRELGAKLIMEFIASTDPTVLIPAALNPTEVLENKKTFKEMILSVKTPEMISALKAHMPKATKLYDEAAQSTANIIIPYMNEYYTLLGKYDDPEIIDFLLETLADPMHRDTTALLYAFLNVKDPKIIDPLLAFSSSTSKGNKAIIARVFLNFNEPKTYAFLIQQAAMNQSIRPDILEFFKTNSDEQAIPAIKSVLEKAEYNLLDPLVDIATQIAVYIDHPSVNAMLLPILDLTRYDQSDVVDGVVGRVSALIGKTATMAQLPNIFDSLMANVQLPSTHDYYAVHSLFDMAKSVADRVFPDQEYIDSYMNELKTLADVYKSKQRFNLLIDEAKRSNSLLEVKGILQDIIHIVSTLTEQLPAPKILANVRFYLDRISVDSFKSAAQKLLDKTNYTQVIKDESILPNVNYDALMELQNTESTADMEDVILEE